INEGTDQVFTDLCKFLSTTSDLIGGAQSEQTSIHASNFVAISIANGQSVMQAKNLAIHFKDRFACLVHDGRIFSKSKELLTDEIPHAVVSSIIYACLIFVF